MIKQIFLGFGVFLSSYVFSQNQSVKPYYSEDGIEIRLIPSDCINEKYGTAKQYLLIEIANVTGKDLKISFDKELLYNGVVSSTKENSVEIVVPKNSVVAGTCEIDEKQLYIFTKMLNLDNVRKLTKYELKNIQVEKVN